MIEGLQNRVKRFFWHRCKQYHLVETLTAWGESKEEWVLIRENIPCRFMGKIKTDNKKDNLFPLWGMEGKVLLPREILLEKGDLLEIDGFFGRPIWVQAKNSGICYLTHQEVSVVEREKGEEIGRRNH